MVTGAGTATTPTRLSPLEAAVARVRAADDFPAVSGKIQQLMEVLNDEDTHVQRLANLIIQDYSLTLKLLRNAHSFASIGRVWRSSAQRMPS